MLLTSSPDAVVVSTPVSSKTRRQFFARDRSSNAAKSATERLTLSSFAATSVPASPRSSRARALGERGPVQGLRREPGGQYSTFSGTGTHVSRQIREQSIGLAASYKARIELIALEAPLHVIKARNAARAAPVPPAVIERLANKWEAPDPTEAHTVEWLSTV